MKGQTMYPRGLFNWSGSHESTRAGRAGSSETYGSQACLCRPTRSPGLSRMVFVAGRGRRQRQQGERCVKSDEG